MVIRKINNLKNEVAEEKLNLGLPAIPEETPPCAAKEDFLGVLPRFDILASEDLTEVEVVDVIERASVWGSVTSSRIVPTPSQISELTTTTTTGVPVEIPLQPTPTPTIVQRAMNNKPNAVSNTPEIDVDFAYKEMYDPKFTHTDGRPILVGVKKCLSLRS